MKKSIKILFGSLLAGVTLIGAGCVSSTGFLPKVTSIDNNESKIVATQSTTGTVLTAESETAAPTPTQINLSGGHLTAKALLTDKGFGSSERAFSSIRFGTTLGTDKITKTMADSNPYGWPTVYLGVKAAGQDYYDISQATDFYIFLKNVTGSTPKIKWRAVDSDGTVQRIVNYSDTSKGDMRSLAGATIAVNTNSNYLGNYVSTTDTGIFLHSVYAEDSVMTTAQIEADSAEFASGADNTFDSTKVVAFMLSIYSYGTKTFDIGSMSAVIGGEEVTIWDADEASEKKYADTFTSETPSFSDFKLNKNEWYLGAIPASIATDSSDWETNYGIIADYQNAEALEYTYQSGVMDAWVPLYEDDGLNYVKNETTFDLSACNALVFNADFTGATGTSAIDFMIRPKDDSGNLIQYKSTGRAILLYGDGTRSDGGTFSNRVANSFPADFKGKVIIPFSSFVSTSDSTALLSECDYLDNVAHITAIVVTTRADTYNANDTVKINDIQVLQKSAEELTLYEKLVQLKQKFDMQTEATLGDGLDGEPFGIRFGVDSGKAYYDALKAAFENLDGLTYEFGMVIVPATSAYDSAMPYGAGILTVKQNESGQEENNGYWYCWYAGITGISDACYDLSFTARAYVQYTWNGETYVLFAANENAAVASLYDLCKDVSENEQTEEMKAVIAVVEKIEQTEEESDENV